MKGTCNYCGDKIEHHHFHIYCEECEIEYCCGECAKEEGFHHYKEGDGEGLCKDCKK